MEATWKKWHFIADSCIWNAFFIPVVKSNVMQIVLYSVGYFFSFNVE